MAGRRTPTRPRSSRPALTRSWRDGYPRGQAYHTGGGPPRCDDAGARFHRAVRRRSRRRDRFRRHPRERHPDRRGPHGRCGTGLRGAHRTPLPAAQPHAPTRAWITFAFMTLDHDGKVRMDCSSPYAMAGLDRPQGSFRRRLRERPQHLPPRHRHAVGPDESLLTTWPWPYLAPVPAPPGLAPGCRHRQDAGLQRHHRSRGTVTQPPTLRGTGRVPSGSCRVFWLDGALDSAARRAPARPSCGGTAVWTTDKDGIILGLLAAEIMATAEKDPDRSTRT